jgi:hypothetical protein
VRSEVSESKTTNETAVVVVVVVVVVAFEIEAAVDVVTTTVAFADVEELEVKEVWIETLVVVTVAPVSKGLKVWRV